ncbi:hypothetical protein HPB51_000260 [Rhipicephalus microplus]|uniref:Tick transposon n=1 Tax=Rhipicephalus microplus TaxID=6941 RepID=A0A9J6D3I4_RHIMP|nr:hypothetical protein HPB51_000260 [Rhipicephalus microplus]
MYRDILRLRLKTTGSENAWAHFSRIINRTTEFLWNHVLPGLRQSLRKKTPVPKSQVKVIGNTTLPDNIREVLELGPKFAVEPKKSAPELLGMVRQVSKQVPDAESDRGGYETTPAFGGVSLASARPAPIATRESGSSARGRRQRAANSMARPLRRGTSSVEVLLSWFLAACAEVDLVFFLHVLAFLSPHRGIYFNESVVRFASWGQGTSFTGSCNVGGDAAKLGSSGGARRVN